MEIKLRHSETKHSVESAEIYINFSKNFVKSTYLVLNYTKRCFHEIFSNERKFLVFPQCEEDLITDTEIDRGTRVRRGAF